MDPLLPLFRPQDNSRLMENGKRKIINFSFPQLGLIRILFFHLCLLRAFRSNRSEKLLVVDFYLLAKQFIFRMKNFIKFPLGMKSEMSVGKSEEGEEDNFIHRSL